MKYIKNIDISQTKENPQANTY